MVSEKEWGVRKRFGRGRAEEGGREPCAAVPAHAGPWPSRPRIAVTWGPVFPPCRCPFLHALSEEHEVKE